MKASQMDTLFTSNPKRRVGFTVNTQTPYSGYFIHPATKIDLGFIAQNTFLKTHLSSPVLDLNYLYLQALD